MESTSPISKQSKNKENVIMNFSSAINQLLNGKKIHKLEWIDKEYYGILENTILKLHKSDSKMYNWILNEGDLIGEDYIVI